MITIQLKNGNEPEIDWFPNLSPYCHRTIEPIFTGDNLSANSLELIFKCPSTDCSRLFIGTYDRFGIDEYSLRNCNIGNLINKRFSDSIKIISPAFIKIYNESYFAEQHKLTEICGGGYRKALEFLIKDYLIVKSPKNEDNIKRKLLGNCIKDDIANLNIKKVAERAVWLGNDVTHYVKTWEGKNLEDLKKLIQITIHWIEMEEITNSLDEDMPNKKQIKIS